MYVQYILQHKADSIENLLGIIEFAGESHKCTLFLPTQPTCADLSLQSF